MFPRNPVSEKDRRLVYVKDFNELFDDETHEIEKSTLIENAGKNSVEKDDLGLLFA